MRNSNWLWGIRTLNIETYLLKYFAINKAQGFPL